MKRFYFKKFTCATKRGLCLRLAHSQIGAVWDISLTSEWCSILRSVPGQSFTACMWFFLSSWVVVHQACHVCMQSHLLPPSRKNRSFSSKICSIKTIYLDCNEIHLIKRISSTKKLLSAYSLVRNGWAGLLLVEEGQALAEPAECCR